MTICERSTVKGRGTGKAAPVQKKRQPRWEGRMKRSGRRRKAGGPAGESAGKRGTTQAQRPAWESTWQPIIPKEKRRGEEKISAGSQSCKMPASTTGKDKKRQI